MDSTTISPFLIARKVNKITCPFFLTFNKIELGILGQRIEVIGFILTSLLQFDQENPKILGGSPKLFNPYVKLHISTNIHAFMSKDDFRIKKVIKLRPKNASEVFCHPRPYIFSGFQIFFFY